MHLTRLELQGFKSFAKKTTLLFPKSHDSRKGVTVIVGPNGSGKTNLVDALRWVMGEQSLKTIRGKKGEDVLFAGSPTRPAVSLAEVSLTLENDEGSLPVDWKEVMITRRAYRDGENEYLMNKNKVRLQDIALLLAQGGFGQETYAVVGQGMADAILNSSPWERKEFFDDAAGVKPYVIKKEQAKNKLELTQENLAQAQVLLSEIEPRYRSLSRQIKKLERREETLKELRALQSQYFGRQWQGLNEEVKRARGAFERYQNAANEQEKNIETLKEHMSQLEQTRSKTVDHQGYFQEIFAKHDEISRLCENKTLVAVDDLKTKISEITILLKKLQENISGHPSLTQEAPTLATFFDLQKQYIAAEEKLRTLLQAKQEGSVVLAKAETKTDDLKREIIAELNIAEEVVQTTLENIPMAEETEAHDLLARIARAKDQLAVIGGLDPEVTREYEETKTRFEFLSSQIEDLTNAFTSTQKIIQELEVKIESQFNQSLEKINANFIHFFSEIFDGGQASLELVQETPEPTPATEAPQEEVTSPNQIKKRLGIEIKACPPGKRIKNIASLSGGERALTSLALLYAILAHRPPPFVVLDEVDAALDESNSRKSLRILKELSQKVQCIVISHNRTTMEQADTLYGITLNEDGSSRLISLRLSEMGQEQISALAPKEG